MQRESFVHFTHEGALLPTLFTPSFTPQSDAAAAAVGKKKSAKPTAKRGGQQRKPAALPEADSVHAAARANVEANKKLSDKINYKVLDDLFDSTRGKAAAAGSKGACASVQHACLLAHSCSTLP